MPNPGPLLQCLKLKTYRVFVSKLRQSNQSIQLPIRKPPTNEYSIFPRLHVCFLQKSGFNLPFSKLILLIFFSFTQKKNQREKALNLSTSLAAEEKDQYRKFMTVDYMSSEHSMSESDEGEANEENGYESLIWKDQRRKFLV